jgi:uncharacterized protein YceK
MVKSVLCLLLMVFFLMSGCLTIKTGGGHVESCGMNMKYCAPGGP